MECRRLIVMVLVVVACATVTRSAASSGNAFGARAFVRTPLAAAPRTATFASLFNFPADAHPSSGVIAVGGMLYGTEGGTEGNGKVFSATTEGTVTDLYRFKGSPDGSQPEALTAFHGELYGVTFEGGYKSDARPFQSRGCGVLFAITLAGVENVRSPFKCANWDGPHGKLVVDGDALFGETVANSTSSSDGSIFMARGDGTKSLVYAFPGTDGSDPTDGLVDLDGTLYGTTEYGGKFGDGTVFAVLANGTVHVIFDFNGADGQFPIGGLTAVDGAL